MTDAELLDLARRAAANSYSPYSRFPVGAALECADGTVFSAATWRTPPTATPSAPSAPPP